MGIIERRLRLGALGVAGLLLVHGSAYSAEVPTDNVVTSGSPDATPTPAPTPIVVDSTPGTAEPTVTPVGAIPKVVYGCQFDWDKLPSGTKVGFGFNHQGLDPSLDVLRVVARINGSINNGFSSSGLPPFVNFSPSPSGREQGTMTTGRGGGTIGFQVALNNQMTDCIADSVVS